jgi:hypothetical protein
MPYSGATYVNVSGATTAIPGQIIQSAVWDNIHNDIGTALTMLMSQLISTPTKRNILWMNGGFEVWQRGAGASASIAQAASLTGYTADRWYLITGANQASVVSAQTGLSSQSQIAARVRRNAAETGTTAMTFGYPLELDEIVRMRNKIVSLSFAIQAGALFSPTSGTLTAALYVGTGAVAKRGGGFAGETTMISIATNLTPGGATVAISGSSSVVVPATSTQAELQFTWTPVGVAGATDDFTIDDVQLEANNSASTWTPSLFDRAPFHDMLQSCKRHYQKTYDYSIAAAQGGGLPGSLSYVTVANQLANIYWQFPVECRATAGITTYNPQGATANWQDVTAVASVTASVDTANSGSTKGVLIYGTTATATVAISHLVYIQAAASASI